MEIHTVERAYQLAPECTTIDELRLKLEREGYSNVHAHLKDSLRRELAKLLKGRADEADLR